MAKFFNEAESERIISGMKWMGLFSSDKAIIIEENLLDTLCAQLKKLKSFQPGERDLVMLQHKFVVEWPSGQNSQFLFLSLFVLEIFLWMVGQFLTKHIIVFI